MTRLPPPERPYKHELERHLGQPDKPVDVVIEPHRHGPDADDLERSVGNGPRGSAYWAEVRRRRRL